MFNLIYLDLENGMLLVSKFLAIGFLTHEKVQYLKTIEKQLQYYFSVASPQANISVMLIMV